MRYKTAEVALVLAVINAYSFTYLYTSGKHVNSEVNGLIFVQQIYCNEVTQITASMVVQHAAHTVFQIT